MKLKVLPKLCCALLIGALAGPVFAQLDEDRMIEGLADLGMTELLEHLIETEPPKDPAKALFAQFQAQRATFNNDSLPMEQRFEAIENAMDTLRKLITDHSGHWERPTWQVSFGELALFIYLPQVLTNAQDFYDYGVPTAKQRQAVESIIVETQKYLDDADLTFFSLQRSLPLDADHNEKRVHTGKWERWTTFYNTRLPFARMQSSYFVATLPDDHPYFAERDKKLPQKIVDDPAGERNRLLAGAIGMAELFVTDDRVDTVARPAMTFLIRAAFLKGDLKAAAVATQQLATDVSTIGR